MSFSRTRVTAFALFFIALASVPRASARSGPFVGLGGMLTYEHEGREKRIESRLPFLLRGGYSWTSRDIYLEYSTFSDSDAAGNSSVERRNHALLGWFRHRFAFPDFRLIPFIAAGWGVKRDSVRMRLDSQTFEANGQPEFLLAVAPGFVAQLDPSFRVGGEIRLTTAEVLYPNPQFAIAGFMTFTF